MTDSSIPSRLLGLLGRFLLFLAFLILTYPMGLLLLARLASPRLTAGGGEGPGAETGLLEIVEPFDGFTEGPKPIPRPDQPPNADDSWARPGERLIVAPDAPEGSWPMVEGLDGRLYQLTPSGRYPK